MQASGNLYFKHPLLMRSLPARFGLRVMKSIVGIFFIASATIFVMSDVNFLVWLGLAVFAYCAFCLLRAIVVAKRRNKFSGGNLYEYVSPKTLKLIETAYDRSSVVGGSVILNVLRELIDLYQTELILKSLRVERDEFVSKLEQMLLEEKGIKETRDWKQNKLEELIIHALTTQGSEKRQIENAHLLRAMRNIDHERAQRLFNIFQIDEESLDKAVRYHINKADVE